MGVQGISEGTFYVLLELICVGNALLGSLMPVLGESGGVDRVVRETCCTVLINTSGN